MARALRVADSTKCAGWECSSLNESNHALKQVIFSRKENEGKDEVYEGFEWKAIRTKSVSSQIRIGVNGVLVSSSEVPLDTLQLPPLHGEDQQIGRNVTGHDYEP